MTIGFITPEYPHPNLKRSGGIGTSIRNLAISLTKSGTSVTVFVIGQNTNENFEDEKVKILSFLTKKHLFLNWFRERKRLQKEIQKVINQQGIQIIEAPDWAGITAFMRFNIPLVIRLHGTDAYFCHLEGRKQKWKNYILEKKALKSASTIVSVSKFTAKITKSIFNIKTTIQTIHNGVDTDFFKPIKDNEINKNEILYFGTIIRKKGLLELAQIFNQVVAKRDVVSLLLVGPDVNDLQTGASSLSLFYDLLSIKAKDRVTYKGAVSYDEIKSYISSAHIVVLPSLAEAFPMSWLEVLAMGKVLISSDIGWANELMISGETGYALNPKNHNEFAQKIIDLLEDSEQADNLAANGRIHVLENFSTQKVLRSNFEFFTNQILK